MQTPPHTPSGAIASRDGLGTLAPSARGRGSMKRPGMCGPGAGSVLFYLKEASASPGGPEPRMGAARQPSASWARSDTAYMFISPRLYHSGYIPAISASSSEYWLRS